MAAPLPQQVDGLRIAGELGCGVCHRGMPEASVARDRTPGLGPSGDPLPADFIFDYRKVGNQPPGNRARALRISSVTPSLKNSASKSELMFLNGRTAMDLSAL